MDATPPNTEGPWDNRCGAMVLRLVSFLTLSFPLLLQVEGGWPGRVVQGCESLGSLHG